MYEMTKEDVEIFRLLSLNLVCCFMGIRSYRLEVKVIKVKVAIARELKVTYTLRNSSNHLATRLVQSHHW